MLELDAVDAGYDGFQAMFGVSLEVNAGEAVAVIGRNGAGKTTLMRVCWGSYPPDRWHDPHGRHRLLRRSRRTASSSSASRTCRKTGGCSPR